jgi:hypothetical protein
LLVPPPRQFRSASFSYPEYPAFPKQIY